MNIVVGCSIGCCYCYVCNNCRRFLVVEGNYKYKLNNRLLFRKIHKRQVDNIAMSDTHAACMNFVNALEKIPCIIAWYEERTAKLKDDVLPSESIVSKTWGMED